MKTTITREQLKRIHDIACKDWKKKIAEYALGAIQQDPFSETISFTEKQIQEMVSAATKEQLPTVKEIFQIKDITSQIKSIEDAIKYLGEEDEDVAQLNLIYSVKGLKRNIVAYQELVVIIKALNEKQELDWEDTNKAKYFTWWYLGKNFRLCFSCDSYFHSPSPSRLGFVKKENADYAASQFEYLYKEYLNE